MTRHYTAAVKSEADTVIVGAGAAGLFCAIHAGRATGAGRVVLLDGARTLGAKILVAGGGRCNVTHDEVDETAFSGSTPAAIRKVLRRFDVARTIRFFADLGVELKREATGKLFPVTDRARTVLDALVGAVHDVGVEIVHPWRVEEVERHADRFMLRGPSGSLHASRVVLATGGRSLPKSGSDGHGFALARALGHTLTPAVFQALVPLLLPEDHPLTTIPGVAAPARVEVQSSTGKRLRTFEGPLLCTHFGISGPVVLDISRHWLAACREDAGARLVVNWLPGEASRDVDAVLQGPAGKDPVLWLAARLPARLARTVVRMAGWDPAGPLSRERRRALVEAACAMRLPITGPRGWTWAEVTAGGVPLRDVRLDTLRSRRCPGLSLCGEILDVDGRIGGFNFQWAWASGYVAGTGLGAGS